MSSVIICVMDTQVVRSTTGRVLHRFVLFDNAKTKACSVHLSVRGATLWHEMYCSVFCGLHVCEENFSRMF